jgi:predicted RNA-binding protein with PUA-like domain
MVDVRALKRLAREVSLQEIKATTELSNMALVRVGRLSVTPVTASEWKAVLKLSGR